MKRNFITGIILSFCFVIGITLISYASIQKKALDRSVPVEATSKCNKTSQHHTLGV